MARSNTISRYVAVVDSEDGEMTRLVPHLDALGFRCLRVPDAQACDDLLRRFPKLACLAVNAKFLNGSAETVLATAHKVQPKLPIFWLEEGNAGREFHSAVVHLSEAPSVDHLTDVVDDALRSRFYDNELVELLRHHTERSFASLGTISTMREPFIKASSARLSDVNAVLTFRGPAAEGYLVIGCNEKGAREAAARMFEVSNDELTMEQVGDVLGEVANRVIGALMPYFESNGAPVSFGLPLFVGSRDALIWNKNGAPSLALEFDGAFGQSFVELSLTEFLPGPRQGNSASPMRFLQPEWCMFQ